MFIEGYIHKVFFTNDDTGVGAFNIKSPDGQTHKVLGTYFNPRRNEYVSCEGSFSSHSVYGAQFDATYIKPEMPEISRADDLKKFLKAIGKFDSDELLEISKSGITKDIAFLEDINLNPPGLSRNLLFKIRNYWQDFKDIKAIAEYLIGSGVPPVLAKKIHKVYGSKSIEILEENPYKLLDSFEGSANVSFKTIDGIALKLGINSESPYRIRAGIKQVLKDALATGHTFLPLAELLNTSGKFLDLKSADRSLILEIKELRSEHLTITKVSDKDIRVSLTFVRNAEEYCKEALSECLTTGSPYATSKELEDQVSNLISDFENATSLSLSDEQREAVLMVFKNKISIITGNPGTGKTTVCKCILYIFNKLQKTFDLASPTGRAAKRLQEVTGFHAQTIHRLLEYSPAEGGFQVNEGNPLASDYLLVDEFSMVDIFLFRHLLKGHARANNLILVGDPDQLPSVQAGSVLRDCIDSGLFGKKHLSKIYRQDDSNLIVLNAHAINKGMPPKLLELNKENDYVSDFLYVETSDPDHTLDTIKSLYKKKLAEGNTTDSIQILSPKKDGVCGIKNINTVIQEMVNGDQFKLSIKKNGITFRVGDRVLQTKNDYMLEVFNGDTGIILDIFKHSDEDEDGYLRIDFGSGLVINYPEEKLSNMQLAYAMTIHKSQGSEYPIVIMPLLAKEHYIMLYRNLFYTGITRAKRKLYLVGQKRAVDIAVKNVKSVMRYTSLFV